jgi:hypothetical protein
LTGDQGSLPSKSEEQDLQGEELSWGCWIEWEEEGVISKEESLQQHNLRCHFFMAPPLANITMHAQAEIMYNDHPSSPVAIPRHIGDHHPSIVENCHWVTANMGLIFEFCGEVADIKYQIEQLDQKVNLLLALQSHHDHPQLNEDMES